MIQHVPFSGGWAEAREAHEASIRFLGSLSSADTDRVVELPWSKMASDMFGFPVAAQTLGDTLVQVPAHSSHHRGQVCSHLRESAVDPPMTDYIIWIWRNRAEPVWPEWGR